MALGGTAATRAFYGMIRRLRQQIHAFHAAPMCAVRAPPERRWRVDACARSRSPPTRPSPAGRVRRHRAGRPPAAVPRSRRLPGRTHTGRSATARTAPAGEATGRRSAVAGLAARERQQRLHRRPHLIGDHIALGHALLHIDWPRRNLIRTPEPRMRQCPSETTEGTMLTRRPR